MTCLSYPILMCVLDSSYMCYQSAFFFDKLLPGRADTPPSVDLFELIWVNKTETKNDEELKFRQESLTHCTPQSQRQKKKATVYWILIHLWG